jgi:hypothetical protein
VTGVDKRVVRIVLQRVDAGDLKKAKAVSNDAKTGGGARDLRFNPQKEFFPFFQRMFKGRSVQRKKTVCTGTVFWDDASSEKSADLAVWPPYPSRPGECKIGKVASLNIDGLIKNDPNGGLSVILLFEQSDGTIRMFFTTETSLRNDGWDPKIKSFAKRWFDSGRKSAFLDLEFGEQYP